MKNFLITCLLNICVSYFTISILTIFQPTIQWSGNELLYQFILSLVLGLAIAFANLLFSITHWPYVVILSLHYGLVLLFAFTIGLFGHWFSLEEPITLLILFIQVTVIYILLWLFFYLSQKKEIEHLNKLLQESRGKVHDEDD